MFKVTVTSRLFKENLEGDFYAIIVDNERACLLLFKDELCLLTEKSEKIVRYAIPLSDIDSFTVEPYEDNEQTISSC